MRITIVITLIFLILMNTSGCVPKFSSRYDKIKKQNEYVSMKFEMDEAQFINKNKDEIQKMLGDPVRIIEKKVAGTLKETWIYYPRQTNNFVAMFIVFEKEKVISATYESVI